LPISPRGGGEDHFRDSNPPDDDEYFQRADAGFAVDVALEPASATKLMTSSSYGVIVSMNI